MKRYIAICSVYMSDFKLCVRSVSKNLISQCVQNQKDHLSLSLILELIRVVTQCIQVQDKLAMIQLYSSLISAADVVVSERQLQWLPTLQMPTKHACAAGPSLIGVLGEHGN